MFQQFLVVWLLLRSFRPAYSPGKAMFATEMNRDVLPVATLRRFVRKGFAKKSTSCRLSHVISLYFDARLLPKGQSF